MWVELVGYLWTFDGRVLPLFRGLGSCRSLTVYRFCRCLLFVFVCGRCSRLVGGLLLCKTCLFPCVLLFGALSVVLLFIVC